MTENVGPSLDFLKFLIFRGIEADVEIVAPKIGLLFSTWINLPLEICDLSVFMSGYGRTGIFSLFCSKVPVD